MRIQKATKTLALHVPENAVDQDDVRKRISVDLCLKEERFWVPCGEETGKENVQAGSLRRVIGMNQMFETKHLKLSLGGGLTENMP